MTGERAQMLKNLEASLVQLDYVAADLAQVWATEGETTPHELQALGQRMHAARCALEIAIEIFSDFERPQEPRSANGRIGLGRRG
jgi:hypothetical protein